MILLFCSSKISKDNFNDINFDDVNVNFNFDDVNFNFDDVNFNFND